MSDQGFITVNGKQIDVFDVQMDFKPLSFDTEACKQFNEAMKKARESVTIICDVTSADLGTPSDRPFTPTGPVVEGSVEKKEAK